MATKNMPVTNLPITMFYNPQNASFMHISSPVNAIEDNYVTLGYFVKSKMANSRFILEMQNFIKIYSLFLKILRKIEMLTPIKDQNSVEKFRKISYVSHNTAYTKFHQNPSICSQDIKWRQNSDINQGP